MFICVSQEIDALYIDDCGPYSSSMKVRVLYGRRTNRSLCRLCGSRPLIIIIASIDNASKRRFCDHCQEYVSKTTYIRHHEEVAREHRMGLAEINVLATETEVVNKMIDIDEYI